MNTTELPKNYDPSTVEKDIYQLWLDTDAFNPDKQDLPDSAESFTVIMPPPNANAPLHVGHALFVTIEDILIRYARMQGKRTLWLPGTDHAGFETQVVFEKKLEKEGKSRFQMTREEFYSECFKFVQENKTISENGLKRLGASCDFSRNIFTLDPEIVKVVYKTFKKMYDDGLVYRAGRICNWCPKHQTGLADLETLYEEKIDTFYVFQYGPFQIGTARPETKFGDKYVVMHPNDTRYKDFTHGQKLTVEWINGPLEATVIKDEAVDMEFGTGVMTITPWHDAQDFEIAKRHNLDFEQIIDKRGRLLPIAEEFAGIKILEAREKIVEKLRNKNLVVSEDKNYKHNVAVCYKCKNLIEPQIVPQWYVAVSKDLPDGRPSLQKQALTAVRTKKVDILTERFEKIFFHWMENIRDWPISRQIAWGIPIPAKHCACGNVMIDIENSIHTCDACGNGGLTPDTDTFDTWFSSGQWPFATMMANDAKNNTKDFEKFFPTSIMETGWDILFFWVARMIMLSLYCTNQVPFKQVYLHGLVRDKDRQKMSKSKGNVVDPLAVIDTYGCDALRFALVFSTSAGSDIPLSEDKIKGMKHFANKLWNITRFILISLEDYKKENFTPKTDADHKLLEELSKTKAEVIKQMNELRLHEAAQSIYDFTWRTFADIYIEQSKSQLDNLDQKANTQNILLHTLTEILTILHPFMPFVTENIWQILYSKKLVHEKLLITKQWL